MINHPDLKLWTRFNPNTNLVGNSAAASASGLAYTTGVFGNAIVTDADTDGVVWTDNSVFNIQYTVPWTFMCLVATADTSTGSIIFGRYSGTNDKGYAIYISNTVIGVILNNTYPTKRCHVKWATSSTTTLRSIVITYNGSGVTSSGWAAYVNGVDLGAPTQTQNALASSTILTTSGAVLSTCTTNYFYALRGTIHKQLFFIGKVLPLVDIKRILVGLHPLSRS
jgi:hypothetical protein